MAAWRNLQTAARAIRLTFEHPLFDVGPEHVQPGQRRFFRRIARLLRGDAYRVDGGRRGFPAWRISREAWAALVA